MIATDLAGLMEQLDLALEFEVGYMASFASDKAVSNSLEEIANLKPSGFVILKSVIEEVEVIKNG